MFSTHRGTNVIPALSGGKPLIGADSLYASAVIDKSDSEIYIKLVNTSVSAKSVKINLEGLSFLKSGEIETLKSKGLFDYNSVSNPRLISPVYSQVVISGKKLTVNLEPVSVNVITVPYK
jgi:alpha-L-arabinofuranosidase